MKTQRTYPLFRLLVLLVCLGLGSIVLFSTPALAADPAATPVTLDNCADQGVFVGKVVACVQVALVDATIRFHKEVAEAMKPAIYAFITLVIVIFGIKLVMEEGEVEKKTIILLLKIAGVLAFTSTFGGLIPGTFGSMEDLQNIVTSRLSQLDSLQCDAEAYNNGGAPVWNVLDCFLGKLMGYGPAIFLSSSLFGIIGSALFSGTIGVMLFFAGISAIIEVMLLVFRAVYLFLMAYLFIAFLIVLSPIFVSLLLLGVTYQFFDKWLKALISSIIQPMVVFAYLTIALVVLDNIIFTGPNSLQNILSPDRIYEMLKTPRPECGNDIVNDPKFHEMFNPYLGEGWQKDEKLKNYMVEWMSGSTVDLCGMMNVSKLDLSKLNTDTSLQESIINLLMSVVKIFVTAFIILHVMETLVSVSQQLAGGGYSLSPTDLTGPNNPISGALRGAQSSMNQAMGNAPRGLDGATSFVRSLGDGFSGALGGLVGRRG